MRKIAAIFAVLFSVLAAHGQNVRQQFLSIPDSLLPYLDRDKRTELTDLYDIKQNALEEALMDASVVNRFRESSAIDTLTENYLRLTLNKSATWEMKLISADGDDFVVGISHTVKGECPESRVCIYTRDWKLLSDTIFTSESLLEKPENMSDEDFRARLEQISLILWQANFSPDDDDLTLSPSFLFIPHDKKDDFLPLKTQKKLKFNKFEYK